MRKGGGVEGGRMKGERMKWNEEIFPILVSSEDKREWHNKEVCSKMHSASILIKSWQKEKEQKKYVFI